MAPYAFSINKVLFKQIRKVISIIIVTAFVLTSVKNPAVAQTVDPLPRMSMPGAMVHLSPEFTPAYLKGIVIHADNALKFDFIIYKGDKELSGSQKNEEYTKLTKYFMASLAIPDDDQWVNLSPYEKDRIIKNDFGKTEMGRDLLAQDYMLKQITASLIYPEDNLGKKFWNRVFAEAQKQYGTTNIPVNTFNKVWILPDDALIYEKGNIAYVIKNHLRVMLEEDYLSLKEHAGIQSAPVNKTHSIASKIVKEIVLPELQREVNEDQNFAALRQVYSGMLLATWYKRALRESLLSKIYANKAKVKGVDQDPRTNEQIYRQYLRAYKKGVFNFIKEDVDKYTNEIIPRKYFSGGTEGYEKAAEDLGKKNPYETTHSLTRDQDDAMTAEFENNDFDYAQVAAEEKQVVDAAMIVTNMETSPKNSVTVLQDEFTVIAKKNSEGVQYLQTFALGPCIGLVLWDEKNGVGTIAHLDSSIDQQSLLKVMQELIYKHGAEWKNLKAALVGGNSQTNPEFLEMIRNTLKLGDAKNTEILIDEAVDSTTAKNRGSTADSESLVLDLTNWQVGRIKHGSQIINHSDQEIASIIRTVQVNHLKPAGQRFRYRQPILDNTIIEQKTGASVFTYRESKVGGFELEPVKPFSDAAMMSEAVLKKARQAGISVKRNGNILSLDIFASPNEISAMTEEKAREKYAKAVGQPIAWFSVIPETFKKSEAVSVNLIIDAAMTTEEIKKELDGKNILVVDDKKAMTFFVKVLLGEYGANVTEANSPEMAREMIRQAKENGKQFDFILTDTQMPSTQVPPSQEAGVWLIEEILKLDPDMKSRIAIWSDNVELLIEKLQQAGRTDIQYFDKKDQQEIASKIAEMLAKADAVMNVARTSQAKQKFWGIKLISDARLAQIKEKYVELKKKEEDLNNLKKSLAPGMDKIYKKVSEINNGSSTAADLGISIDQGGDFRLLKNTTGLSVDQKIEKVMAVLSENSDLFGTDAVANINIETLRSFFIADEELEKGIGELRSIQGYLPPREYLSFYDHDYLQRAEHDLFEEELPANHFFVAIKQFDGLAYLPIKEDKIVGMLRAFGVDATKLKSPEGAEITNKDERIKIIFRLLKPLIENSDAMPYQAKETFRWTVASYIFQAGIKALPFNPVNMTANDFMNELDRKVLGLVIQKGDAKTGKELADKLRPFLFVDAEKFFTAREILGDRDFFVLTELHLRGGSAVAVGIEEFRRKMSEQDISNMSGEDLIRSLYRTGAIKYVQGSEVPDNAMTVSAVDLEDFKNQVQDILGKLAYPLRDYQYSYTVKDFQNRRGSWTAKDLVYYLTLEVGRDLRNKAVEEGRRANDENIYYERRKLYAANKEAINGYIESLKDIVRKLGGNTDWAMATNGIKVETENKAMVSKEIQIINENLEQVPLTTPYLEKVLQLALDVIWGIDSGFDFGDSEESIKNLFHKIFNPQSSSINWKQDKKALVGAMKNWLLINQGKKEYLEQIILKKGEYFRQQKEARQKQRDATIAEQKRDVEKYAQEILALSGNQTEYPVPSDLTNRENIPRSLTLGDTEKIIERSSLLLELKDHTAYLKSNGKQGKYSERLSKMNDFIIDQSIEDLRTQIRQLDLERLLINPLASSVQVEEDPSFFPKYIRIIEPIGNGNAREFFFYNPDEKTRIRKFFGVEMGNLTTPEELEVERILKKGKDSSVLLGNPETVQLNYFVTDVGRTTMGNYEIGYLGNSSFIHLSDESRDDVMTDGRLLAVKLFTRVSEMLNQGRRGEADQLMSQAKIYEEMRWKNLTRVHSFKDKLIYLLDEGIHIGKMPNIKKEYKVQILKLLADIEKVEINRSNGTTIISALGAKLKILAKAFQDIGDPNLNIELARFFIQELVNNSAVDPNVRTDVNSFEEINTLLVTHMRDTVKVANLFNLFQFQLRMQFADEAMQSVAARVDRAALSQPLGGIDFNSANLNLQIKRDGRGVPLPISQQDLENIHIDGLIPVILGIKPAMATPILSELQSS